MRPGLRAHQRACIGQGALARQEQSLWLGLGVELRLAGAALAKAIAVAIHLEDADVVRQPVEQRAGQALGTEGICPFVEGQIAGDQGGPRS